MHDKKSAIRIPAAQVLRSPVHLLAFGLGSGLAPKGPGTFGTIAALPFWLALRLLPPLPFALTMLAAFALGCWLCGSSARRLGVHDYGGIVFDEFVGMWLSCTPLLPGLHRLPDTWPWLLAAFVLFRLFDIWKPWPIRVLDRRVEGGLGIMLDDVLAAGYAAAVLAGAGMLLRS